MRAMLITLSLVAMALAGCADNAAPVTDDDQTAVDDDLQATSTTGVIRGVVVDDAIVPIAEATIKIKSLGLETTSLEDGSFGFSDLEPGAYFMDVSKIGYSKVQAQAQVEAGVDKPPVVRVQLVEDLASIPAAQTQVFEGHLRCAGAVGVVGVAGVAFPCSVIRGTEDAVGDYNGFVRNFEAGLPDFFQAELQWTNTQPAGESLTFDIRHCCDNDSFGRNGSALGPSPLTANVDKQEMEGAAVLEDGMEISVFGAGLEALRDAAGVRLGVQIEQPFTIYYTETFNFRPEEGWTFIKDGQLDPTG